MPYSTQDASQQRRLWLIKAPLGLGLIGFGISLIVEAGFLKHAPGTTTYEWVLAGTLALCVFNAGLCVFGDAVKHRGHYERLRDST
ncbi:MAG: hypothetical protein AAGJ82_03815 [Bacteroidota bacterium]